MMFLLKVCKRLLQTALLIFLLVAHALVMTVSYIIVFTEMATDKITHVQDV